MGKINPEAWIERRREKWPNPQTRAEAARLHAGGHGLSLKEALERYPDEVISVSGGKTRPASRRAIWAEEALIQEHVGWEPTIKYDDRVAVERSIREEGLEIARARTGSTLVKYLREPALSKFHVRPDIPGYANQAPASWRSGGTNE